MPETPAAQLQASQIAVASSVVELCLEVRLLQATQAHRKTGQPKTSYFHCNPFQLQQLTRGLHTQTKARTVLAGKTPTESLETGSPVVATTRPVANPVTRLRSETLQTKTVKKTLCQALLALPLLVAPAFAQTTTPAPERNHCPFHTTKQESCC